jgi:hypothetical protein
MRSHKRFSLALCWSIDLHLQVQCNNLREAGDIHSVIKTVWTDYRSCINLGNYRTEPAPQTPESEEPVIENNFQPVCNADSVQFLQTNETRACDMVSNNEKPQMCQITLFLQILKRLCRLKNLFSLSVEDSEKIRTDKSDSSGRTSGLTQSQSSVGCYWDHQIDSAERRDDRWMDREWEMTFWRWMRLWM